MDENNLIDKRDNALEEMAKNEKLIEYIKQCNERLKSTEGYDEMLKTITDELHKEVLKETRKTIENKISKRQEYNIKCLNLLRDMILSYPELRFGQILYKFELNGNIFNEESVDTYERIKEKIQ